MSLSERIQWKPPQPDPRVLNFEKKYQAEKQQPFLDDAFKESAAAACTWQNLRYPRLGRFKLEGDITFTRLLGFGLDGIVWKVETCNHTYALKVFWDNHAPDGTRYWAIQRECQNASLLEAIRLAIEHAQGSIWLNPEPKSIRDATMNLHAFSDEGRRRQTFRNTAGAIQYSTVPHLRQCYGWTMLSGEQLCALPLGTRPPEVRLDGLTRKIVKGKEYHAIVYEYVPDSHGPLISNIVQDQLDLFWLSGFCMVPLRAENWKGSGKLVDIADLICPWHAAWFPSRYRRRYAKDIIKQ